MIIVRHHDFLIKISLDTPSDSELVSLKKDFVWGPSFRQKDAFFVQHGIQVWTDYFRTNVSHFKA